jgi:glycosyltransferase involved in cell wall biosynthesis
LLALSGYFLAKLSGSVLITNVSDIWPLSAKEMGAISDGFMYRSLERIEHFIYKKSAFCMGQSGEIVSHLRKHGSKEAYLFRNGVDPARFKKQRVTNPSNDNRFILVYAGLLGFAQGIYELCKAINFRALGTEFHIYGAGGEQLALTNFLEEHPDRGIIFHGTVTREDIPSVLSKANATLIPLVKSIYGAVPSKIYESMAAGVPILFSGDGEGPRIILENNVGWVSPPADYAGLSENIKYLVQHPEEVEMKRKMCREAAENKFNRPRQIKALFLYLESFE